MARDIVAPGAAVPAQSVRLFCIFIRPGRVHTLEPSMANSAPSALRFPRVRLLATGGTIAGAQTGGSRSYQAGAFSIDALIKAVPQLATLARLEVEQVAALGSQDMNEAIWQKLAARTEVALADPDIAAVVITHGTDTMEETGYFLNLTVHSAKPVVLVGAMRPATEISADGPMNLYNAVAVAASPDTRNRGVLIVANDEIHFAREVSKTNTTQVGTFKASHRGLAGLVNAGRLHLATPRPCAGTPRRASFPSRVSTALPRVDIIYACMPAWAASLVEAAAVRAGAKGLVIAGVGDGNLNEAALAATAAAARAGVAVVRSSRTGGGVVERNIEVDDDELGFIAADELNPQKARVLLMLYASRAARPTRARCRNCFLLIRRRPRAAGLRQPWSCSAEWRAARRPCRGRR